MLFSLSVRVFTGFPGSGKRGCAGLARCSAFQRGSVEVRPELCREPDHNWCRCYSDQVTSAGIYRAHEAIIISGPSMYLCVFSSSETTFLQRDRGRGAKSESSKSNRRNLPSSVVIYKIVGTIVVATRSRKAFVINQNHLCPDHDSMTFTPVKIAQYAAIWRKILRYRQNKMARKFAFIDAFRRPQKYKAMAIRNRIKFIVEKDSVDALRQHLHTLSGETPGRNRYNCSISITKRRQLAAPPRYGAEASAAQTGATR